MDNALKNKIINTKINERKKRIKELWNEAHKNMTHIYGEIPDVRILNRFYTEKMIFGEGDSIIFWDLAATIRSQANKKGYTTSLGGTDGSCFTAYLLGMCENPLPIHYLCPECKKTEFINEPALPWDMPDKPCKCGGIMHAEGFDVPFETHIRMAHQPRPNLWVSPAFLEEAEKIVIEKASGLYRLCKLTKPEFVPIKFVFLPFDGETNFEDNIDESGNKYDTFPGITIIPFDVYRHCANLSEKTGVDFREVNLNDPRIIEASANGNIDNIPNFKSNSLNMGEALCLAKPRNCYDLLQFLGAMHGTNTWCNNAERLIRDGICSIGDIPAHRDDVFILLRDKLREAGHEDVGIAYNIATKIRFGAYAQVGISAENRALLEYLDMPGWFISYIEKIDYMFPKAHNIESLRTSLTFMWYKINYPEVFNKIMKGFGV